MACSLDEIHKLVLDAHVLQTINQEVVYDPLEPQGTQP